MEDGLAGRKLECAYCKLKFAVPTPGKTVEQMEVDGVMLKCGVLLERSAPAEETPPEPPEPASKYAPPTAETPAYVSDLERGVIPPPPEAAADRPHNERKPGSFPHRAALRIRHRPLFLWSLAAAGSS